MAVETLVPERTLALAALEVLALDRVQRLAVVAQQFVLFFVGVDPVAGRANVVRRLAAFGTGSAMS